MRYLICVAAASFVLLTITASALEEDEHPRLTLTRAGVAEIRSQLGRVPLFDSSLSSARLEVDAEIASGIDVPIPKDYSGGYTHERHKRNFFIAQKAGALFQILEDEKYARYVHSILREYADIYRDLPLHPQTRSYARGRLFWQCLNDANWLVYMSQAYDAIRSWLPAQERHRLERDLFRPFADHLSIDNPQFFNRIHNHSTWGTAAVGMLGLVINDDELVQRALYGLDLKSTSGALDDDGGFIRQQGQGAGFLANLDEAFSPDGYYTEGPYYQRYAMYPFLIFAQSLQNVKPELRIFERNQGMLGKSVTALLNLADADGDFFPFNDAQKGMSVLARELVTAVDVAWHLAGRDARLLSVAETQGRVLLDDAGFYAALAVRDGLVRPLAKRSINLSDGSAGKQGGVAVLRYGNEDLTLVFKYTSQGLSHGHYDKLSLSLHAKGSEVLQDYGMVRFVNIEQKGGGNYLPENTSWAKQTIAHNTLTLNESSHFGGKYEVGSRHHSELRFFDDADPEVQVVSAVEKHAYPGAVLFRTLAVIRDRSFTEPYVLDIFRVVSEKKNTYDLPWYYLGQIIDTSFEYSPRAILRPLGKKNGYQHLYLEAEARPDAENIRFSWLSGGSFYTLTSVTLASDQLLLTRLGANDPGSNLRKDPGFMIRRRGAGDTVFVSVIEPHGSYSPVTEIATGASSRIRHLKLLRAGDGYTAVSITNVLGEESLFITADSNISAAARHQLEVNDSLHNWTGPWLWTGRGGAGSANRN